MSKKGKEFDIKQVTDLKEIVNEEYYLDEVFNYCQVRNDFYQILWNKFKANCDKQQYWNKRPPKSLIGSLAFVIQLSRAFKDVYPNRSYDVIVWNIYHNCTVLSPVIDTCLDVTCSNARQLFRDTSIKWNC